MRNLLGVCDIAQSVITVRLKNPPCLPAGFPRVMHSSNAAILAVASWGDEAARVGGANAPQPRTHPPTASLRAAASQREEARRK